MTLNVDRLRSAVEYAEAHPEQFDMNEWVSWPQGSEPGECGTHCCLAGTIVALHHGFDKLVAVCDPFTVDGQNMERGSKVAYAEGEQSFVSSIRDEAAYLVGLDDHQAIDELFGLRPGIMGIIDHTNIRQHVEKTLGVDL